MTQTTDLLNEIYTNVEMGCYSLRHIIRICEDRALKTLLEQYYDEYQCILEKTNDFFRTADKLPRSNGVSSFGVRMAMKANLAIDKTSSHLAEMLVQGATMGIIDITRALKDNQSADEEVRNLAERLLTHEDRIHRELRFFV